MDKIAIDIVILPPDDIMDVCVQLSNKFKEPNASLVLNKTDCLPHLSLFMGAVEETKIQNLGEQLEKIAKNFNPLNLTIKTLEMRQQPDGRETYFLAIKNSPELQNLHEKIVNECKNDYQAQNSTKDMFFVDKGENFSEATFFWTNNYCSRSSLKNFWPHITLKAAKEVIYNNLPLEFAAYRLAICHLGDRCTCRKILWETTLK